MKQAIANDESANKAYDGRNNGGHLNSLKSRKGETLLNIARSPLEVTASR